MKADNSVNTPKEVRVLGPLIDKIMLVHEKNQQKQFKAQSANHNLITDYNKRKKKYEINKKNKESQVVKNISQERNKKVQLMKKKSEHVRRIMDKFHRLDQQRIKDKIAKISKRNFSSHKSSEQYSPRNWIQMMKKQIQFRSASNSLNLQEFYNKIYVKTDEMCKSIMQKSLEKQEKAQANRKIISEQRRIKQLNQSKVLKKIKADEDFNARENLILRKSIQKIQLSEKRVEEITKSQRQKSIQKREQQKKNGEKIKKKRQTLQFQLQQKFLRLERMIEQKNRKMEQNKQNLQQSLILNKKSKRLKQEQSNSTSYNNSRHHFYTKMSEMYRKDREQWGFLTSVGQFKDVLIQRNIYENSQLSLLK